MSIQRVRAFILLAALTLLAIPSVIAQDGVSETPA
jgi:hypothetical protein